MTDNGEALLLVSAALVIFSAGWILRGVCDALLGMLRAGRDYWRARGDA